MVHPSPMDKTAMTTVAIDDKAQQWLRSLEDRESARSNMPLQDARKVVARRLSVAPGTLENLRRGRIKGIRAGLFERLRMAVVRELETEIGLLNHELEMARRGSLAASSDEISAMEAQSSRLRELASAKTE
jgi:hypothetical protein